MSQARRKRVHNRFAEQGLVRPVAFVTRILAIMLAGAGVGTFLRPEVAPFIFIVAFVLAVGPWSR